MKLSLVTVPNPVLNQPTKLIKVFDKKLAQTVTEMKRVLNACRDPEGVGLAAPQVGLGLRLFITKPYPESTIKAYINPQILQVSKQLTHRKNALEGCLSVTNTWSDIVRPKAVTVKYQDIEGKWHTEKHTGWEAQIILHEMDHLEGTLFTFRAMEQERPLYRIEKNHKGIEELVPIEL